MGERLLRLETSMLFYAPARHYERKLVHECKPKVQIVHSTILRLLY